MRRLIGYVHKFIVSVSMLWTIISIIVLVRIHSYHSDNTIAEQVLRSSPSIRLPHLSSANELSTITAERLQRTLASNRQQGGSERLLGSSVVFGIDSSYYFEEIILSDCGCPSSTKDRYYINLRAINPATGQEKTMTLFQKLSAERIEGHANLFEIIGGGEKHDEKN